MKYDVFCKIIIITISAVGIILSWGGMIYATCKPTHFRVIGIIVALAGYVILSVAALCYEYDSEE